MSPKRHKTGSLRTSCAIAALVLGSGTVSANAQTPAPCTNSDTSCQKAATAKASQAKKQDAAAPAIETITVTAQRLELLGVASTASEGVVTDQEVQLTPAYRPGQLLETVPGLIVTLHSGEGKANQYLMRGYNLDHGTDLATDVDDMPVNQPTHAHGQGYTDLNFMIPELADQITYTKGPYYANVGDFGSVGSVNISYRDAIPTQISTTIGTYGFERVFAAGMQAMGDGQLLAAGEFQHYDGPFVNPDDARKENAVLRYSEDGGNRGYSVTGMFYHQDWNNTTDIPLRAITEGDVINSFGTLDPTDGGHAVRASLSGEYHQNLGDGLLSASAFYEYNQLHIFNDFTQYLVDPVNGDQEDQFENRNVVGGSVNYTQPVTWGGFKSDLLVGAVTRYDMLGVGRLPSKGQQPLISQEAIDPVAFSDDELGESVRWWCIHTVDDALDVELSKRSGHAP